MVIAQDKESTVGRPEVSAIMRGCPQYRNPAYCAFGRTPGSPRSYRRTPLRTRAPPLRRRRVAPVLPRGEGHRPEPAEQTADGSRGGASGRQKSLSKIKDYDGS